VREAILSEVLDRGLHPSDELDLPVEMDKTRARVDRIDSNCVAEAEQLLLQVMRISSILVILDMLPIQDIPQLPKST
jgi:hypothetical protein